MERCDAARKDMPRGDRPAGMRSGFTLIELLLVIGIIAILAAIVIVAINPTKQLGQARDAQRRSDVNTILNAIWQYSIDHNGALPCAMGQSPCIDATSRMIGTIDRGCSGPEVCPTTGVGADGCITPQGLTGTYIPAMPYDPRYGSGAKTYYVVRVSGSSNRLTVSSCRPEQGTGLTFNR